MSKLGIQVPPGFTITTEACNYFSMNKKLPDGLKEEIISYVSNLEGLSQKSFGNSESPLLLSVRSGGMISMPGMMDSILNIGCLLYTSPSPRDVEESRMPSSA